MADPIEKSPVENYGEKDQQTVGEIIAAELWPPLSTAEAERELGLPPLTRSEVLHGVLPVEDVPDEGDW